MGDDLGVVGVGTQLTAGTRVFEARRDFAPAPVWGATANTQTADKSLCKTRYAYAPRIAGGVSHTFG